MSVHARFISCIHVYIEKVFKAGEVGVYDEVNMGACAESLRNLCSM
jgi:hypothetical protein